MPQRLLRRAFGLAVLALLAGVGLASAQTDTGRIEGIVTDNQGGVIPGVTVTVTNLDTGVQSIAVTDGEGRYVVTGVRAGRYSVDVALDGFQPARTESVLVSVNQIARFDYTLQPAGVTESVQVVAQSPIMERVTSSLSTVIEQQEVEELPLNGRNFTQLATLTPGVNRGVPNGNASGASGNVETFRYGDSGGGALSVNGVREQFNNYMLDGVDNNESLVNSIAIFAPVEGIQEFKVVTSGAQAEFGRAAGGVINVVTKSGSNTLNGSVYGFFRDDALDATPWVPEGTPEPEKLPFYRRQYGGSVGGPIVANRAFFFGEYQGQKENLPTEVGRFVTVPTAQMRRGDFSQLLNPAFTGLGAPVYVFDPLTGQPFSGNIIPTNRLNVTAVNYLNFYPQPDLTDRLLRNYGSRRERNSDFNNFTGRFDYVLSDKANMFYRLSFGDEDRFDPGFIPGAQAGFGSGTARNEVWGNAIGYNRVLSNNWVTEVRIGINNQEYAFLPVGYGNNLNAQLGIGGPGGINNDNGISLIGGGDGRYIEYLGDFGQYIIPQQTLQFAGSATWLKGPHTMKFGASLIRRNVQTERSQFGKGFYFYSDCIATPSEIAGGRCGGTLGTERNTGYEVANMLIGRTDFTITGYPEYPLREMINWENSFYVQDDWQLNDRLTLNLGLRYDIFTPYYEAEDQLANFDRTARELIVAGVNGVSRSTMETDWNNFGPRAGLAYQINSRTVLRGAYGLFYTLDRGGIDNQLIENPPFVAQQFRGAADGGSVRLSDQIILPARPDPENPQRQGFDTVISAFPENRTSQVHQFNVTVQREITPTMAAFVAYVGTRGDNLTTTYGGPNLDNVRFVDNIGSSDYDALQLQLRQSLRNGLSFLSSYTLSKAKTDTPGPLQTGPGGAVQGTVPGLDPGSADYDRRHYFSFAATYELPWGRDIEGMKGFFASGWQVNTIITFATGSPFSVFDGNSRAKVTGDWQGPETEEEWFNTAAFSPANTIAEQHERNLLYGPGISTVDFSLFKSFPVVSDHRLEFRLEFFNLFNKAQWELPNANLGDPNFGRITQQRLNSQFQTQIGLRYLF